LLQAYQMRIAIVEILCTLIRELDSVEDDSALKQISGLFAHLYERTMDTSSYVRVKVFNAFARLCAKDTLKRKYPKYRLKIARYAKDALDDKTPTVRKGAISCLIKLIETHPWDLGEEDGGLLSHEYFVTKYKDADQLYKREQREYNKLIGAEQEGEDEEGAGPSKPKTKL
jgi:condensin complex subunit 1